MYSSCMESNALIGIKIHIKMFALTILGNCPRLMLLYKLDYNASYTYTFISRLVYRYKSTHFLAAHFERELFNN